MELVFDILRFTLPGLIVFITAYYLLKMFLENQRAVENDKIRMETAKTGLPLRLNAYERLTILCDRTDIGPLVLRLRTPGMTASQLKLAMMVALNHEFDHNVSQMMYVSETLYKIISLARSETLGLLSDTPIGPEDNIDQYITDVFRRIEQLPNGTPMQQCMAAIRTEVKSII